MKIKNIKKIKNTGGVIAFIPWGMIGKYALNSAPLAIIGFGIQVVGVIVLLWGHKNDPDSMPVRWSWRRSGGR